MALHKAFDRKVAVTGGFDLGLIRIVGEKLKAFNAGLWRRDRFESANDIKRRGNDGLYHQRVEERNTENTRNKGGVPIREAMKAKRVPHRQAFPLE